MKLIGFNFSKISIERKENFTKTPEVKTSMNISEIKEIPSELFKSKETPLEVKFSYGINYADKVAELAFEGTMAVLVDPKEAKEILKKWKGKDLSLDFKYYIFNVILRKANIRAIQLEDEMNLPPHFQMPSIKFQDEKDKKSK